MQDIIYKATRTGEGSALVQLMNATGTRARKNYRIAWATDLVEDWTDELVGFLDMHAPDGRTDWGQMGDVVWITVAPR